MPFISIPEPSERRSRPHPYWNTSSSRPIARHSAFNRRMYLLVNIAVTPTGWRLVTDDGRLIYFRSAVQFRTSVMGCAEAGGWVSTRNRLPSGATSNGAPKAKTFRRSNRL